MTALFVSAFLMGLFGGAHCVGMCGGATTMVCADRAGAKVSAGVNRIPKFLAFNAGRALAYAALGMIVGALGSAFGQLVPFGGVQLALRAFAAVCMLAVGLHLLGVTILSRALESAGGPLWRKVAPVAKRLFPLRRASHALVAGMLWALLPCGLIYAALALAASAPNALAGGATMGAFALGTMPAMLSVGAVAERVSRALGRQSGRGGARPAFGWLRHAAGVVVLGFGLWSSAGLVRQVGGPIFGGGHACCHHGVNAGSTR